MAKQSALMEEKMKKMGKKNPLTKKDGEVTNSSSISPQYLHLHPPLCCQNKQKKVFDSADYYKEKDEAEKN